MFRRITALVSATALAVVAAVVIMLAGSSAQISFAAVMDQLAKTRSVTFKQIATIPGNHSETVRVAILSDGVSRTDYPNGDYEVVNPNGNTALFVAPSQKRAKVFLGVEVPRGWNPYEMIHDVGNERSTALPGETVDGQRATVFRVEWPKNLQRQRTRPPWPIKVWVDPETKLPIRIEPVLPAGKQQTVMYDFKFDEPLEPSLFSIKPPKGYTIIKEGLAKLPPPPTNENLLAPRVIPGVGLGPVKFGMTRDEVVKIIGKPDVEKKTAIEYPSRGYGFAFSKTGALTWIYCFSQEDYEYKTRDFAGKTKEGVGIGSTLEDIKKAFGKPDSVGKNPSADGQRKVTGVHYKKLGLHFGLIGGKVAGFSLLAPRL